MREPRPDFLIVGAMKCGTSTLHEQLAAQPGVFMTTPKEPCFFSDDDVYARGLDWYRSLFAAAAPADVRGESSTHYAKLPTHPHTVERLRRDLGNDVRVVYVMRNPIERLVSHYVHDWTENLVSGPVARVALTHPGLVDYGRYAMQLRPWLEALGPERVLPVLLERLSARPQEELARIAAFVGHTGRPVWRPDLSERNVSKDRLRRSPVRDLVLDLPGLRWARRNLVPHAARERVKRLWSMTARPELPPELRTRLEAVFDEDLAVLGSWLGVRLSCSGFRETALGAEPLCWRTDLAGRDGPP